MERTHQIVDEPQARRFEAAQHAMPVQTTKTETRTFLKTVYKSRR